MRIRRNSLCLATFLCALFFAFGASRRLVADSPRLQLITTGWNAPTAGQFARDISKMPGELPLTGAVLTLHADSGNPNPLATAHDTSDWSSVDVRRSVESLANARADQSPMPDNYLVLHTNPGDVDWMDEKGWETIVQHYRVAAKLAKDCGLRGLLIDFEPYKKPFRQFQYSRQSKASSKSFAEYKKTTRQRGRQVMRAVAEEYPAAEIYTYFALSYLIKDHPYRGPSPVQRGDEDWCLAGHSYGLLPAFIDGMLDEIPDSMTLVDGCENAYWFKSAEEFAECAQGVRDRAVLLVSPENRSKYSRQIRVAFPIYLDAVHSELAGRWTLQPSQKDRLALLRRNFAAALRQSDGRVWLYGEHGRWWPEAGEEALWKGKDVFPTWEEQLPGIGETLRQVIQDFEKERETTNVAEDSGNETTKSKPDSLGPKRDASVDDSEIGATVIDAPQNWESWVEGETGSVALADQQATITGAEDASGLAVIEVTAGNRYMVQAQVVQQGRGLTRMVVRWRNADGEWFAKKDYDVVSYPPDGDPYAPRTITAIVKPPPGLTKMVVVCNASQQMSDNDIALFGNLMVGIVDPAEKETKTTDASEAVETSTEIAP